MKKYTPVKAPCDICGKQEALIKRSDREGHSVYICQPCNAECNKAKMRVRDVIALAADRAIREL